MKDINILLKELQEFLDFVNKRDELLWNRYLIRCTLLDDSIYL